jgi:hypothetical protein
MNIKKVLQDNIPKQELKKLNIMSFHLTPPEVSSSSIIYQRKNAISSFHNTQDLRTGGFQNHSSLLISSKSYEEFRK